MAGFSAAIYSYTATPSARDYRTISDDMRKQMGVTPPVIPRLENNITKASIDTLTRYAHACGIKKTVIVLY